MSRTTNLAARKALNQSQTPSLPQNHLQRRRRKRTRGQVIARVVLGSLFLGSFLLLNKLQQISVKTVKKTHGTYHKYKLTQKELFRDPMRRSIAHQDDDNDISPLRNPLPRKTTKVAPPAPNKSLKTTSKPPTTVKASSSTTNSVRKVEQVDSATTTPHKSAVKCPGKEKFVQILSDAGKNDTEIAAACDSLPLWSDVTNLYGEKPVVFGLDTCEAFRKNLVERKIPKPGLGGIKVAGMFNSGTNALALTLMKNMDGQKWHLHDTKISDPKFQALGFQPNVVWGKHSLLQHTNADRLSWEEGILPVVVIKDPYTWLHSMCKTVYDEIKLDHAIPKHLPKHCPSVIMTPDEKKALNITDHDNHVVVDRFSEVALPFPSMVEYWNSWYKQYFDATFPRIIVRFEDTIFHAEAVTDILAKCVGNDRIQPFQYYAERAKKFKKANDFLKAIIRYGSPEGRHSNMTTEDLKYTREKLDKDLMDTFKYHH